VLGDLPETLGQANRRVPAPDADQAPPRLSNQTERCRKLRPTGYRKTFSRGRGGMAWPAWIVPGELTAVWILDEALDVLRDFSV